MYAIVEIAGQQYKVEKDQQLFVHRLEGKEGSKVTFDNVLLTSDGKKVEVGAPAVKGVSVSAKIVEHLKGDKVIVFKKKRRKGYKVRNGHRQYLSKIEIESIGAAKKAAPKAKAENSEAKKEAAPKAEAKKTTAKKETAKKAPAKKAAPAKETKAKSETAPKAKAKPAAKKAEDKKEDK
jgi:large subunit ribosomal protein L21